VFDGHHQNHRAETKFPASPNEARQWRSAPALFHHAPKSLPIIKCSIDRICNFAKRVFRNFLISFDPRSIDSARRAWRSRALPRLGSVEPTRLNPSGDDPSRGFSSGWRTGPTEPRFCTTVARCSLRSRRPRQGGAAKRPALTFAARRAPRRCRAGTEERSQAEQKNWAEEVSSSGLHDIHLVSVQPPCAAGIRNPSQKLPFPRCSVRHGRNAL